MKIAVTSTGPTLDDNVDARFGRCAYFLIIDTETMDFDVIENQSVSTAGGAGINSAKTVIDAGADAVITSNCGPNAERTLTASGISIYTSVKGTVKEAVEAFKNGKLTQTSGPTVGPNFGAGN